MLDALLWNLELTAALAVVLTVLGRVSWLAARPALRHWLWLMLLVKLVTPPVVALPLLSAVASGGGNGPSIEIPVDAPAGHSDPITTTLAQATLATATATSPQCAPAAAIAAAGLPGSETLATGLLAVWLLGTCVILVLYGASAMKLSRWLRRAAVDDPALAQACAEVAARLGVRRGVRCCAVEARTSPLVLGWLRPLVLVPRQFLDQLGPRQLRGVVAHELAHLVRRDHWANLFVFIVKSLLWWNPVVWWAERQLHAAAELCCDAIAIDRGGADRRSYARTLLAAIDFIQSGSAVPRPLAAAMGSRATILRRFEMIGQARLSYRLSRGTFLLLAALIVPLVCMPVHGQDPGAAPAAKPATTADAATDSGAPADPQPPAAKPATPDSKPAKAAPKEIVLHGRPHGTCSIAGKVIDKATGKPVPGARMYLFYLPTYSAIFVNADDNGDFLFKDIPTGPYSLQTSDTPGYQNEEYNPEGKVGPFPHFSLSEGEQRDGIVIEVARACSVSGRVFDENGKVPADAKTLTVLAWFKEGDGKTYENKQARVDPRDGSYKIDGLGDKPVYVMAINWRETDKGNAFPPTYYPGTFSRSEAKQVTFDKGPSVENVNITRPPKGGLTIAGTVHDESGKPIPEAFVVVHRRDMLFDLLAAYTDAQGRYEIQGLGDGEFLAHVDATPRGYVRTSAPIDLDGRTPVTPCDFTLTPGVTISGRFVDQDGKPWQIAQSYGYAHVVGKPEENGGSITSFTLTGFANKYAPHTVRDASGNSFLTGEGPYFGGQMLFPTESTFVIQGVMPGHTTLSFAPQKEGQKVAEIRCNGRNVLDSGIDTRPGQEIKDVTIVIQTP